MLHIQRLWIRELRQEKPSEHGKNNERSPLSLVDNTTTQSNNGE